MINIFIDTTVTYQDPFFRTVANSRLLNIVRAEGGKVYISSVVLQETREHYRRNLSDRFSKLNSALDDYNSLLRSNIELNGTNSIDENICNLNRFYTELQNEGILEIVDYDNGILPELVNRATTRRKPCSRNKAEFRDTIIWLSYCRMIIENNLESCYFITNNTSDFYDDDKINLHEDLIPDLGGHDINFRIIKSSREIDYSEEVNNNIPMESVEVNIDEQYLRTAIDEKFKDDISIYIQRYLAKGAIPSDLSEVTDYFELEGIDIKNIMNLDYELIENDIYIYSDLRVEIEARRVVYAYISEIDYEEPYDLGSATLSIDLEVMLTCVDVTELETLEITGEARFIEI